jgi:ABC-type polysaccharide/polyol phosphate export permease
MGIFKTVFQHSHTLRNMVSRDIRTRYSGSALGIFWSIINPIIMLLVFTFVFSIVFNIRIGGYGREGGFLEFFLCGFLPWLAFQEGAIRSTSIIVENTNLVKRVRFPSELLILSTVISIFFLQLIGFGIFIGVLFIFGKIRGSSTFLLIPLVFLLQIIFTTGLGFFLSSIQVFFRDVAQMTQSLFWVWFYGTPVVYAISMVPEKFRKILMINPMTHLLEIYRVLILQGKWPDWGNFLYFSLISIVLFILGERVFFKLKPTFDDYL